MRKRSRKQKGRLAYLRLRRGNNDLQHRIFNHKLLKKKVKQEDSQDIKYTSPIDNCQDTVKLDNVKELLTGEEFFGGGGLRIFLDREKFAMLATIRGWRSPQATLAKKTGFTRSYISQVVSGAVPVSNDFMMKYIAVCGADLSCPEECWGLFTFRDAGSEDPDHPMYNYDKYMKKRPYKYISLAAEHAKLDDQNVEHREEPDSDEEYLGSFKKHY